MDENDNIPLSQTVQEITKIVSEITSIDTDLFIRRRELGDAWVFSELENGFKQLKEYLKSFKETTLTHIPDPQLNLIKQNLDNLLKSFEGIKKFSPNPPAQLLNQSIPANYVQTQKTTLINAFNNALQVFYSSTQTIITFGITAKLETLESFYLKQTGTATKTEIKKEANLFDQQAEKNRDFANWWLFASIVMAGALLIFIGTGLSDQNSIAALFKQNLPDGVFKAELIRQVIIRLLVISTITFALIFCVKNYNAQRHNAIVKTHKSNCLNVFYVLQPILTDPATKNDVLSAATKSIFENHETGYSGKDAEIQNPNIISTIVEKSIPKAGA